MKYEFYKIKNHEGIQWYFHPVDITDVKTYWDKLVEREVKAAMNERSAHTFKRPDGSTIISYHAQTSFGRFGEMVEDLLPYGVTWEMGIHHAIRSLLNDWMEMVQRDDLITLLSNGVQWMALPNPFETQEIIEVKHMKELEFPYGKMLTPADIEIFEDGDKKLVYVDGKHIGTCDANYLAYREGERYIKEYNKELACKNKLTRL